MSIQLKDLRQISKKCNEERFHTLFDFCSSKRDILLVLMCIEKFKKVERQTAMAGPASGDVPAEQRFVHLTFISANREDRSTNYIGIIKAVRNFTSLGLKEAKDITDALRDSGTPKSLGPLSPDLAAAFVRELRQNGCTAEAHTYR